MNLTSLFKISKKCNVPLIADSQTAVIKVIVLWGCTNFPSVLRIKAGLANASSRKVRNPLLRDGRNITGTATMALRM